MAVSHLVRSAALEGFSDLLVELSADPEPLLLQARINPRFLADPDHFISYRAVIRLLELAARETNCPHLGLLLSRKQGVSMLGAVGLYVQQAPNVRSAVEALVRYVYLHAQGARVALNVAGDRACITFGLEIPGLVQATQIVELSIGIGYNILRELCGPNWSPRAVKFCHDGPKQVRTHRRFFNSPVHFNRELNGLMFDASFLDNRVSNADNTLRRYLGSYLESLEISHPHDIVAQVRQLIRSSLATGDCAIEHVAQLLSVNKRTLQRQLKEQGTTFAELLESVRIDMARQYLSDSDVPLTQLTYILGYSELSVFSRAFKRWFGKSPRAWKRTGGSIQ